MTDPALHPLEFILRQCARAAPAPWYPSVYVRETGTPRETLDPYLEQLRLSGLVRLTDWEQGKGQGYALTPAGTDLLQDPRGVAGLRSGWLPPPQQPPDVLDDQPQGPERGERVREALLGPQVPRVTFILLFLNIAMFLVGLFRAVQAQVPADQYLNSPNNQGVLEILHRLGAIQKSDFTATGDRTVWWRLLACCFLHFGWIHLGMNMYSLYVIGPLLERLWGPVRFLLLYLISGVCGSCAMVIGSPAGALGAGASGAIWGIMATLPVWILLNRRYLPQQLASDWMRQLVIVFIINVGISFIPGVSATAHFGGGLAGALAAVPMNVNRYSTGWRRWLALAAVFAVPILSLAAVDRFQEKYRDVARKNLQRIRDITKMEQEVLPSVVRNVNTAANVYQEKAAALLAKAPIKRDPDAVDQAVDELKAARDGLAESAKLLQEVGPFNSRTLEEARQAALDLVETQTKRAELAEQALQEGANWKQADREAFQEQEQRVEEARKHWREIAE